VVPIGLWCFIGPIGSWRGVVLSQGTDALALPSWKNIRVSAGPAVLNFEQGGKRGLVEACLVVMPLYLGTLNANPVPAALF
jgi:hypothetical protein